MAVTVIGDISVRSLPNWPGHQAPAFFGRTTRRRFLSLAAVATILLVSTGADPAYAEDIFRVGVMSGDGELLMGQVAIQAKALGLPIRIVAFSDYLLPNEALNHGELDANAFQHLPYRDSQLKSRG